MVKKKPDDVKLRNLVVHGWDKQDHEPLIEASIKAYLRTGDPTYLQFTRYEKIREGLLPK